ncbi:hypothetical protein DFH06DRAFT_527170 [Mycena polygramma]|nr:hypothetical protein DFH06DRAFT_527170 [Mycena polygramma]
MPTRSGGRPNLTDSTDPGSSDSGLTSLPVDVLDEIVSHFPTVSVPLLEAQILSCSYLIRTRTLLALSETCRRFRSVFLPSAWRHLEICASRRVVSQVTKSYYYNNHATKVIDVEQRWGPQMATEFARELVWQMEVVTVRNPALASNVRVVSVLLSEWSAATVFPEFFRCLALLPNLHTIQIVRAPSKSARRYGYKKLNDPFGRALSGYNFPGVRTLVLHEAALGLVQCCPNVDTLTLNNSFNILALPLPVIAQYAPHLRSLNSAPLAARSVLDLARLLPNLQDIPPIRTSGLTTDTLKHLAKMKNLHKLVLVEWNELLPAGDGEPRPATLELVAVAKQVLRGSSSSVVAVKVGARLRTY